MFRWWARRPHSFAGALLDAARVEFGRATFLVADPFSGGGTVAFEATRRGLPIYAQDLYPWPSQGLATALTAADPDEFKRAANELLQGLRLFREAYWRTEGDEATIDGKQHISSGCVRQDVRPVRIDSSCFASLSSRSRRGRVMNHSVSSAAPVADRRRRERSTFSHSPAPTVALAQ